MANELSTGTGYASLYGPTIILDQNGDTIGDVPVTVYQSDGATQASLYTDQTRATAADNPVYTDAYGNLNFYTDPGYYILSFVIGETTSTQNIVVLPWYTDAAWNVVNDVPTSAALTETPLSGDSRIANTTSYAVTYDLPAEGLGMRIKIANEAYANACTVTANGSDVIKGLGLGTGATSITLNADGAFVELHGTGLGFWEIVAGGQTASTVSSPSGGGITTSGTFVDVTGASVTVVTGTKALVILTGLINVTTSNIAAALSVAVSGASTYGASATYALTTATTVSGLTLSEVGGSIIIPFGTGGGSPGALTAGSNTFQAQAAVGGSATMTISNCVVTVQPLN